MKKVLILLLSTLLLFSCDIFMDEGKNDGKLYLVAIGMGYQQNPKINRLDNTYNDFRGIVEQFETLAELAGREYEITTFSDFASISGNIVFGFDHIVSSSPSGSIFNPDTERMRKPEVRDIDTRSKNNIRKTIIDELINVFESTSIPKKDDLIIFYFTGHGTEKTGPVIHHSTKSDAIYTDISIKELEERFFSRYDARTVAIMDCCYSGKATLDSELGSTLGFRNEKDADGNGDSKLSGFDFSSGFKEAFTESGTLPKYIYLTASTDKQKSYEYDIYQNGWNSERYGAFTYQILRCWGYDTENMKTAFPVSKEGSRITLGDMYDYIRSNMSSGNRKKSTPSITRSRYDITLFDFRK